MWKLAIKYIHSTHISDFHCEPTCTNWFNCCNLAQLILKECILYICMCLILLECVCVSHLHSGFRSRAAEFNRHIIRVIIVLMIEGLLWRKHQSPASHMADWPVLMRQTITDCSVCVSPLNTEHDSHSFSHTFCLHLFHWGTINFSGLIIHSLTFHSTLSLLLKTCSSNNHLSNLNMIISLTFKNSV